MSVGARQDGQGPTKQSGSRTGPQTQRNVRALETQGKSFSGPWEEMGPYQAELSAQAGPAVVSPSSQRGKLSETQ